MFFIVLIVLSKLQEVQSNAPYLEHQLNVEQLIDLYPLSRIELSSPELSHGLKRVSRKICSLSDQMSRNERSFVLSHIKIYNHFRMKPKTFCMNRD